MSDDKQQQQSQRDPTAAVHRLAEVARRDTEAAQEAAQRTTETTRRAAEEGAAGPDFVVRQLAEAAQAYGGIAGRITEEVRALAGAPVAAAGGVQELSRTWAECAADALRRNVRFSQDALLARSLPEIAQLHARYVEESLAALREGGARVLEAAVGLAEHARDPLAEEDEEGEPVTVAKVMTRHVRVASPDDTVQEAARVMAQADAGVLPVGEDDRIIGMLTDRDLAVRVVGAAKDPTKTKVRDAMTSGAEYCFEDEELEAVAAKMAERRLRRLPVLNREQRLVGIVSLGDIATEQPDTDIAGRALGDIAQEGGPHRQSPVRPQQRAAAARQRPQRRQAR